VQGRNRWIPSASQLPLRERKSDLAIGAFSGAKKSENLISASCFRAAIDNAFCVKTYLRSFKLIHFGDKQLTAEEDEICYTPSTSSAPKPNSRHSGDREGRLALERLPPSSLPQEEDETRCETDFCERLPISKKDGSLLSIANDCLGAVRASGWNHCTEHRVVFLAAQMIIMVQILFPIQWFTLCGHGREKASGKIFQPRFRIFW